MFKKIFILFGITFFVNELHAQFSLQQCISMAEKHSPNSQLLPIVRQAESLQISALNKNLLPQTSIGGQATWQSAVTGLPIKFPNVEVPTIPKDQYKATLDFNQTIYDGGQLRSQKLLTNVGTNVELKSIEANIYQLKEQVSNLYFGAILAEKQYQLSEITKEDIESNLKRMKANVQNGTAIRSNSLALEAKLIEINQLQREISSRKLTALKGLSILTGVEVNETLLVEGSEVQNNIAENNTIRRPELNLFEAQKVAAEANRGLLNSKYMPRLNLFGTGGYGRPGLNFLSPNFSPYFIGGVSLKIPVTQLYTRSKSIDYQLIEINKSKIDKQKAFFIQQIDLRISSLREEEAKLLDQIMDDKILIEIRNQMKKSAQNRLENGVITNGEFLAELDTEAMAKQNLVLHQIQLMQIRNDINITIGN